MPTPSPAGPAHDRFTLHASQVDVWIARFLRDEASPFLPLLDDDERSRAERFRFDRHRDRFLFRRVLRRVLLGRYLGLPPQDLRFGTDAQGKPFLADGTPGLAFNASHSGDFAVVAVTAGRAVGVDVERVRPEGGLERVAARFFAADEVEALRKIPAAAQGAAFFRCWTRKEAYLKARGEGLSLSLGRFAVPLTPEPGPALLRFDGDPGEPGRWSREDLDVADGYAGAVVVEGPSPALARRVAVLSRLTGA